MTKLEEFVKNQTGEANSFDVSEVTFWLRAFVKKVRERVPTEHNDEKLFFSSIKRNEAIGMVFNQLVKELELEEK